MNQNNLVNLNNFIVATRDSGYKSIVSALAELVDNSIEANANEINIITFGTINKISEIYVIDNGIGMSKTELDIALQFGGSTRFNSRKEFGRYGMGLPNGSLSQCKRVDVYTWQKKNKFFYNYLDIDELLNSSNYILSKTKSVNVIPFNIQSESGTMVIWSNCDRINFTINKNIEEQICYQLGQIFRFSIWNGIKIKYNNKELTPIDPTFLKKGINKNKSIQYGKDLLYAVNIPGRGRRTSVVRVRFTELPIQKWANLSNWEKRKNHITKNAGVSILRNGREIDYGWYFMGDKRKENYDDWWRCEIFFESDLDEVFGVTHTKQGIKQSDYLNNILVRDIEQIARVLNNRVRLKFADYKKNHPVLHTKNQMERTDVYMSGLKINNKKKNNADYSITNKGFEYEITLVDAVNDNFFDVNEKDDKIILFLNKNHIFYDKIFKALHKSKFVNSVSFIKILEILLFAAARSELLFSHKNELKILSDFKKEWSSNLKTFIS